MKNINKSRIGPGTEPKLHFINYLFDLLKFQGRLLRFIGPLIQAWFFKHSKYILLN